jgi:plastocyanin
MIRRRRSARLVLLAIASVALLGACGDDGGDDAGSSESTSTSTSTAAGATGEAVDCAGAAGEQVTVEIGDFEFLPDVVSIGTCDEIVWTNTHDQPHTSTSTGDVRWSTGNIAPGADADAIPFDTPGVYAYMCALHPFMKGTVEVS